MQEPIILLGFLLLLLFGVIIWSLMMQRKAVQHQKMAVSKIEEEMGRSQKHIENQEKIIAILEDIRDKIATKE